MPHHVENSLRVNVPADKIWEVLKDFGSVEKFATTIESSPLVGEKRSGLGAKRKCNFYDGTNLTEEIVEYHEGQGFKMRVAEHSLPLKSMNAEMRVQQIDAHSSDIYMATNFVVKGGPLGWLMGVLLMRPMMRGVFKKVLSGLAYHAATGERIDKQLPSQGELKSILRQER